MRTTRTLTVGLVAALAISTAASGAIMGTVSASMNNISPGLSMATWITPYDTSWYSGLTGRCNMSYGTYSPGAPRVSGPAYCTEVEGWRFGSWYTMNIRPVSETPLTSGPSDTGGGPMAGAKAEALKELWGRFIGQTGTDNVACAAFQLAVWEIVYEDLYVQSPPGWNVLSGKFKARADAGNPTLAINQANLWLGQVNGSGPKANLYGLSLGGVQDVIVTPEPATTVLLALGGLAMLVRNRRRSVVAVS